VPKQKEGQQQKGVSIKDIMFNTLGPAIPFIKSAEYSVSKMTEPEKKTEEARLRQEKERKYRVPLEVAGSLGFVPLYKDLKKIQMEVLYRDMGKTTITEENVKGLISGAKSKLTRELKEIEAIKNSNSISASEAKRMSKEAEDAFYDRVEEIEKGYEEYMKKKK
jgi:hypothetical protein